MPKQYIYKVLAGQFPLAAYDTVKYTNAEKLAELHLKNLKDDDLNNQFNYSVRKEEFER